VSNRKRNFGRIAAALVFASACFGMWYSAPFATGPSMAATAAEKAEGRRDLDQLVKSLTAVDTSYAAGNAAEAQARFGEALSAWKRISRLISGREAREQLLLFDALGNQLKTSVPPAQIKSTVTGMLDELNDDIAAELK